jgi:hypothetical protein
MLVVKTKAEFAKINEYFCEGTQRRASSFLEALCFKFCRKRCFDCICLNYGKYLHLDIQSNTKQLSS